MQQTLLLALSCSGAAVILLLLLLLARRCRRYQHSRAKQHSSHSQPSQPDECDLGSAEAAMRRLSQDVQPRAKVIDAGALAAAAAAGGSKPALPASVLGVDDDYMHRKNPLYESLSRRTGADFANGLETASCANIAIDAQSQNSYEGIQYPEYEAPLDAVYGARDLGALASTAQRRPSRRGKDGAAASDYDLAKNVGAEGPYYSQVQEGAAAADQEHYYNNILDCNANQLVQEEEPMLPDSQDLAIFQAFAQQIEPKFESSSVSFRGMLNAGAFGAVAKGRVLNAGAEEQLVVITVLPTEAPREGAAALKMASLLQSLNHKRIYRVVGVAIAPERTLLLTEFTIDGTLLRKLQKEGDSLSAADRLLFARDMADALAYVNRRGLAHGDVRAVMMMLVNGACKLTDFGFSRSISAREANLALRWTAPELSLADRPTPAGDAFSFGVFLVELFTNGALPYADKKWDHQEVHKQIKEGYRMAQPATMPDDVFEICAQCWSADPSRRPKFDRLALRLSDMAGVTPLTRATTPQDGAAHVPDLSRLHLPALLTNKGSITSVGSSQSADEWTQIARTGTLAPRPDSGEPAFSRSPSPLATASSAAADATALANKIEPSRKSVSPSRRSIGALSMSRLGKLASAPATPATTAAAPPASVPPASYAYMTNSPSGSPGPAAMTGEAPYIDMLRSTQGRAAAPHRDTDTPPPPRHAPPSPPPISESYLPMAPPVAERLPVAPPPPSFFSSSPARASSAAPARLASISLAAFDRSGNGMPAPLLRRPSEGYECMADAHVPDVAALDQAFADAALMLAAASAGKSEATAAGIAPQAAAARTSPAVSPQATTPRASSPMSARHSPVLSPRVTPPTSPYARTTPPASPKSSTSIRRGSRPRFAADDLPAPVARRLSTAPSPTGTIGGRPERQAPVIITDGVADAEGEYYEEAMTAADDAAAAAQVELVQVPKVVKVQQYEPPPPYTDSEDEHDNYDSSANIGRDNGGSGDGIHGSHDMPHRLRSDSFVPPLISHNSDAILMAPAALKLKNRLTVADGPGGPIPAPPTQKQPPRYERVEDFSRNASAQNLAAAAAPSKGHSLGDRLLRGKAVSSEHQGGNAPIFLNAEADEATSNYLTPRALLEPEWLHGQLGREEAEELVRETVNGGGVPGAFLFRRKQEADAFAITVLVDWDRVEHFLLQYDDKLGWYLNGDVKSTCGDPHHNLLLVLANLCDPNSPWALPLNVPVSCLKR